MPRKSTYFWRLDIELPIVSMEDQYVYRSKSKTVSFEMTKPSWDFSPHKLREMLLQSGAMSVTIMERQPYKWKKVA